MTTRTHRLYRLVLLLAAVGATALLWDRLPDRMPTHWGIDGRVDGWSGRAQGALLLPLVALATWGLAELLPRIDPRRRNFAQMRGAYDLTISAVMTFLAGLHGLVLATALGRDVPIGRLVPAGVGLLLLVVGRALPQAQPNWWFGIRTPWTLSSDRVWARTHRVGGRLMTAAGAVVLLAAVLLPPRWSAIAVFTAVVASSLGALAYSYVAWRAEGR